MTTIATDGKTIACDLQFTHGTTKFKGKSKIFELSPDVCAAMFNCKKGFIGGSGDASSMGRAWAWFSNPEGRAPSIRNTTFLLLSDQGIFVTHDLHSYISVKEKHYSIGSGADFARTAMELGKTPIEAVRMAGKFDIGTGMGYKEYTL